MENKFCDFVELESGPLEADDILSCLTQVQAKLVWIKCKFMRLNPGLSKLISTRGLCLCFEFKAIFS